MSDQERPAAGSRGRGAASSSLDGVDRRILAVLRDEGRLPVQALAEAVGVSRASAYSRLERLRTEGVIEGYSARVNPTRAGLGIAAVVLLSCLQPEWRRVRERLVGMPEVEYAALTTGSHDALLLVRVPDVETLRDVILERLQAIPGVSNTQTIFVLEELVRRPYVLAQQPLPPPA